VAVADGDVVAVVVDAGEVVVVTRMLVLSVLSAGSDAAVVDTDCVMEGDGAGRIGLWSSSGAWSFATSLVPNTG
jgi:hypothetical protein